MDNKDKYREGSRKRYRENPEIKARAEKWREGNKELMDFYRKKWLENNREKHREITKKYYQKNAERSKIKTAKWRANNPEKLRTIDANFRLRNSDKINAKNSMRRAKKLMATPSWLSDIHKAQLQWFYAAAKMMSETSGTKHHVDHIHPLQGDGFNGLHVPWNLRIIKAAENISKGNKLPIEENHLAWDNP